MSARDELESAWLHVLADGQDAFREALHDDVAPSLAATRLALEAFRHGGEARDFVRAVDDALGSLEAWVAAQRVALHASLVRRMGLGEALVWHALELERQCGATIEVKDASNGCELPLDVAVATFGLLSHQLAQSRIDAQHGATVLLEQLSQGLCASIESTLASIDDVPGSSFDAILLSLGAGIERRRDGVRSRATVRIPV